jgi:uncharacterized repeat protein (TIGR03803 family)
MQIPAPCLCFLSAIASALGFPRGFVGHRRLLSVSGNRAREILKEHLPLPSKTLSTPILAICTMVALAIGTAAPAFAQSEAVLYTFRGGTNAALPFAGLVRDFAGNFYGTTLWGGAHNDGTIFKLDRHGKETVIYSFTGGTDGIAPQASLIRDDAGNLYGTTKRGGPSDAGTVFRIDPTGAETVLYSFTGGADGATPIASLIRDKAGNLYGTTIGGGDTSNSVCTSQFSGCGTVFN